MKSTNMIEGKNLSPFKMLPAAPGKCQECAVEHSPEMTHDNRSLFYQYYFYNLHGRWPTWDDAMAHCPEVVKIATLETLLSLGLVKPAAEVKP